MQLRSLRFKLLDATFTCNFYDYSQYGMVQYGTINND